VKSTISSSKINRMLGKAICLFALLIVSLWMAFPGVAQDGFPLATLPPPTLAPTQPPTATPEPITRSALARIRERDPRTVVFGVPASRPPFSTLTESGAYEGFEIDIARALADDWGMSATFKQVTRQNALDMLRRGEVDLLLGQQILTRDAPDYLDFSMPYFVGKQVALAMSDTPGDITALTTQTVGVVAASSGEEAYMAWMAANGLTTNMQRFPMLDDALKALFERRVAAVIADRWELDNRVRGRVDGLRLMDGVFRLEPYAFAMLRYDDSLRTAVNRTLQKFSDGKRFGPILDRWFADRLPESERITPAVWRDLEADTRTVGCDSADCQGFPLDIVRPTQSVVDKIKAGQPIRVAGLGIPPNPDGSVSPLETFNQALVAEMFRRWGAVQEQVPGSYLSPEDVLASGNADFGVGLVARWGVADRVDYAFIYAATGYKMLVRVGSEVVGFGGLRTGRRAIGTFADEPGTFDIARKIMIGIGFPERTIQSVQFNNETDAINAVFEIQNARVLFGDALRITRIANSNKARVTLVPTLYDQRPLAFAVPRNDVQFRMLVEATLQEMARDGTYQRLWNELWALDTAPNVLIYPGSNQLFGVKTAN
jgi:polar amino acid transport system substrate-binding protein